MTLSLLWRRPQGQPKPKPLELATRPDIASLVAPRAHMAHQALAHKIGTPLGLMSLAGRPPFP